MSISQAAIGLEPPAFLQDEVVEVHRLRPLRQSVRVEPGQQEQVLDHTLQRDDLFKKAFQPRPVAGCRDVARSTSISDRIRARGLRSSWEASPTNRCCRSTDVFETAEHRVHGFGQPPDLVRGLGKRNSAMEIGGTDFGDFGSNAFDRLERATHQPPDHPAKQDEDRREWQRKSVPTRTSGALGDIVEGGADVENPGPLGAGTVRLRTRNTSSSTGEAGDGVNGFRVRRLRSRSGGPPSPTGWGWKRSHRHFCVEDLGEALVLGVRQFDGPQVGRFRAERSDPELFG